MHWLIIKKVNLSTFLKQSAKVSVGLGLLVRRDEFMLLCIADYADTISVPMLPASLLQFYRKDKMRARNFILGLCVNCKSRSMHFNGRWDM